MSSADDELAKWREKLKTKDEAWVREQANRQIQPNIRKRLAAEYELVQRERTSELSKAKSRIIELENELSSTNTELGGVRAEVADTKTGSVSVPDTDEIAGLWRVITSCLFDNVSSHDIPQVIDGAGLSVDWSLTDRENYSPTYRINAYRPRINTAFETKALNDQIRICCSISEELVRREFTDPLNAVLGRIDWKIESGQLVPMDARKSQQFFPKQSQHDAYVAIRDLLCTATKSLLIVDPYLDSSLFTVLGSVSGKRLDVRLLTSKTYGDFALEAAKFLKQHTDFSLEARKSKDVHDRFIIIDGVQCWHLGCSIKDAGDRAFMMSAVETPAIRDAAIQSLTDTWNGAASLTL